MRILVQFRKKRELLETEGDTHSDIGFSVMQFPRGKKVRERQGGKSEKLQIFEQVVYAHLQNSRRQLTAAQWLKVVEGNRFGGSIMKDHESKRGKVGWQLVENSAGTQCGVPHCFTTDLSLSSLGSE